MNQNWKCKLAAIAWLSIAAFSGSAVTAQTQASAPETASTSTGEQPPPRQSQPRLASQYDGADACAKIQAAHNVLPPAGGTIVADFSGEQTCATAVTLTKDNVTLTFLSGATYTFTPTGLYGIGSTADNTRIMGNGALFQAFVPWSHGHYNIFESTANDGFSIEGAQVQMTMTGPMPNTITIVHCISVQSTISAPRKAPTNFTVRNNRVWIRGHVTDSTTYTKQAGIFAGSFHATLKAQGGVLEGNMLDDSYGRNIMLYRCEGVSVLGNISTNHGRTLTGGTDAGAKHIRIIGSRSVTVTGNIVASAGSSGYIRAITVEGDSPSENITITGNTVRLAGEFTGGGGAGIFVNFASRVVISGNVIEYAGNNVTGFDGVLIYPVDGPVTEVMIFGNIIKGWTMAQVRVVESTPTDIVIRNNWLGKSVGGAPNFRTILPDRAKNRIHDQDNIEADSGEN